MSLLSSSKKTPTATLLILMNVALLLIGALTLRDTHIFWNPTRYQSGDDWLYYKTATWILHGVVPYRDFALEYPPLAVVPFLVPLLFVGGHAVSFPVYCWLLLAENMLLGTVFALVLRATARDFAPQRESALTWYVLGVVILSPLLPWRYDLFPALLTLLALRAVLKQQPGMAGIWLGLGVAAKLYPAVFLPVLIAYYWLQKDRRSCGRLLAACLAAIAVSALPFAVAGPKMLSFLQYHQHRGIEMESLAAGAIFAAHLMWRMPVMVVINYGAFHLLSPISPMLLRVIPWTAALLLSATAVWSWRQIRADVAHEGKVRSETLTISLTAMLLAFIVTNKVFSPQYMIWFLPLVPLLSRRHVAPFGVAFVLTITLFPFCLGPLLAGNLGAVVLLNLRNLLMVGLLGHLFFSQRRVRLSSPVPVLPIIQARKVLGRQP